MHPIAYVIMSFGAMIAILGVVLFAKRGPEGNNAIRLLGIEFQLTGSSLVIFVVGAGMILVPIIYKDKFPQINNIDSVVSKNKPVKIDWDRNALECEEIREEHPDHLGKGTSIIKMIGKGINGKSDDPNLAKHFVFCRMKWDFPAKTITLEFEGGVHEMPMDRGEHVGLIVYDKMPSKQDFSGWSQYGKPRWKKFIGLPNVEELPKSSYRIALGEPKSEIVVAVGFVDAWGGSKIGFHFNGLGVSVLPHNEKVR